jgi:Zn-dependent protease
MVISLEEIGAIIVMSLAVGYIFSGIFKRRDVYHDPIIHYSRPSFIEDLKYGVILAAPAVVLHELAHKFVAMAFGATATVHAPIGMYIFVILLRLINFPIIFFVGGYVEVAGRLLAWQYALISLAGPLTNIIIYVILILAIKYKLVNRKHHDLMSKAAKLNLFLAAFNMIPFPGFDGYNFFRALLSYIF